MKIELTATEIRDALAVACAEKAGLYSAHVKVTIHGTRSVPVGQCGVSAEVTEIGDGTGSGSGAGLS